MLSGLEDGNFKFMSVHGRYHETKAAQMATYGPVPCNWKTVERSVKFRTSHLLDNIIS